MHGEHLWQDSAMFTRLAMNRTVKFVTAFCMIASALWAAPAANAIPAAPGHELPAGHVPSYCGEGEGTTVDGVSYGYYYAGATSGWLAAPWCLPRWGNLTMTASQVAAGGSSVTLSAISDTNSAQYAPETGSIVWSQGGGTVESGCGASDLTCTVKVPQAGATWQWIEIKVSMPRIFFIDSPGSNCAGLHLCPGFTTHAWSVVGVAPVRTVQVGGLVAEVPGSVNGLVPMSCQFGIQCVTSVQATVPKDTTTIYGQMIEQQNKENAKRWTQMKDALDAVQDLQKSITVDKEKGAAKQFQEFNDYLKASNDAEHELKLQVADAALEQVFPATGTAGFVRGGAVDDGAAIFRALTKTTPTASDIAALKSAVTLARGVSYSRDRARARVILALGLEAGRYVLRSDLKRQPKAVPIGSVSKKIAAGRKAQVRVKFTPLGTKIKRFVDVARGGTAVKARLVITSRQGAKKRKTSVVVNLY